MHGREDFGLALFKAVGLIIGALLCPILAFGIWLLATPDYDGGRQAVGTMLVAAAGVVVTAYCALFLFVRSHRRRAE